MTNHLRRSIDTFALRELRGGSAGLYGSASELWAWGVMQGLVSPAEYEAAKEYYGKGWDYTGD